MLRAMYSTIFGSVPVTCMIDAIDSGASVDEGAPVFYVGLGQPDARTAALTGHKAFKI